MWPVTYSVASCDHTSLVSKTRTAAGHSFTLFRLNYDRCHPSQSQVGLFPVFVAIHQKTGDLRYLGKAQSMNNTVPCFDLFSWLCSVIGQPLLSSPVNHPINLERRRWKGQTISQQNTKHVNTGAQPCPSSALVHIKILQPLSSFKVCREKIRNRTRWTLFSFQIIIM